MQKKKIEELGEIVVREEVTDVIGNYPGHPVMKVLDLDDAQLIKLAMKVAESEIAAGCFINKTGTIVCAAGHASGKDAKLLLDKVLSQLGGSGGGSPRIAQGKAKQVAKVEL